MSLSCGSWATMFGIHALKVLWASGEQADVWRKTAGTQVGISGFMTVALLWKGVNEARIAYKHRYD